MEHHKTQELYDISKMYAHYHHHQNNKLIFINCCETDTILKIVSYYF